MQRCVIAWVIDDAIWEVCEPITSEAECIFVEEGFRTDLASVPRVLWFIFPPFGPYIRASIIHDWLIAQGDDSATSDYIFRRIMLEDGVPWLQAYIFWLAVRFNSVVLRRLRQWFPHSGG